jgi:uncharacterized membrane protein YdjX (TVP38/TMEM64 family)
MTQRFIFFLLLIVALLIGSFLLWGDFFESLFMEGQYSSNSTPTPESAFFAILLIWTDPILPIPVTVILSTIGAAYGFWIGFGIGITGTMGSGILAYGLSRLIPEQTASWLIGKEGQKQGTELIKKHGGWAIAFSRWMAILPEILSGLAGLLRMPFRIYLTALLCGTIPMTAAYVWLGTSELMTKSPKVGLFISAILPIFLWLSFCQFQKLKAKAQE